MNTDKLPPHSPEMERAIIGCILQKPELADDCIARFKVGSEVFYEIKNRIIYDALISMRQAGTPIDSTTVFFALKNAGNLEKIGGLEFLNSCENAAQLVSNFAFYSDSVSEQYMLRKALATCTEAASSVYENQESADSIIDGIQKKLETIREIRGTDEIITPKKAAHLLSEHLETRFQLDGRRSGIVTGLHELDNTTDGLQYGELAVIGARPSQGKTALATSIVHHCCFENKIPTLFVTLEMSVASLCRRILSRHSKVGMKELKSGRFNEQDFQKFVSFNLLLDNTPIFFLDSIGGTTIGRIASAIKRAAKQSGVRLVVIDYLQKIHASGQHEKRTYEVGEVSTQLKAIAVETGVAMLALAQLSREPDKQKGRHPIISDLADSAQIERDADMIGLLHRDRSVNDGRDAALFIAKQRDGELGTCSMIFNGPFASFENLQYGDEQ